MLRIKTKFSNGHIHTIPWDYKWITIIHENISSSTIVSGSLYEAGRTHLYECSKMKESNEIKI